MIIKLKIRNPKKKFEARITYRQTIVQRFALARRKTVIILKECRIKNKKF